MIGDDIDQAAIDIFGNVHNRIARLAQLTGYSRQMMSNYRHDKCRVPESVAKVITGHQRAALTETIKRLRKTLAAAERRVAQSATRFPD